MCSPCQEKRAFPAPSASKCLCPSQPTQATPSLLFLRAQQRTWGCPKELFHCVHDIHRGGEKILEYPRGKHWLQLDWVTLLFPGNGRGNSALKAIPDERRAQGRLRAGLTPTPGAWLIHFSGSWFSFKKHSQHRRGLSCVQGFQDVGITLLI